MNLKWKDLLSRTKKEINHKWKDLLCQTKRRCSTNGSTVIPAKNEMKHKWKDLVSRTKINGRICYPGQKGNEAQMERLSSRTKETEIQIEVSVIPDKHGDEAQMEGSVIPDEKEMKPK